ncbi:TetR/AcrR family transcriptional regulator [Qipengyuania flava]|uniref:TetR/AcrR family transcriptional regulator n=1 Tax=Qipengyuania flava TaxID=192812 RepID=UPI001CD5D38D|nr:TetR/AcrR family transcriptional regulator [Qipengyuania flava]MCA0891803.1 TetR/AcrR family transcriptional regulator [Qipengyuania flava]
MKRQATKLRLLDEGLDQLSVSGVEGITLGRLAGATGMSKSGFFAHFRSKEQLQIELLDQAADTARIHVIEPAFTCAPGLPRLRRLLELWLGWSQRAGLRGGCPIAAALFELDDINGEVRDHVERLEHFWRGVLKSLVTDAVKLGHLDHDLEVDQVVWELCGIYLSHHVSIRFLRSDDADARAQRAISSLLHRYAGEA